MITSVPPYETFSHIKKNILLQSKIYKNHFENSNFWGLGKILQEEINLIHLYEWTISKIFTFF
jgi:hypothetical protein